MYFMHLQYSEEYDSLLEEGEEDEDAGIDMEIPALETELGNKEVEQTTAIKQEEFAELDPANENIAEKLKDKKVGENI